MYPGKYTLCMTIAYVNKVCTKYFLWLWCLFKGDNLYLYTQQETLMLALSSYYLSEICQIEHDDSLHWALHFHTSFSDLDQSFRVTEMPERWTENCVSLDKFFSSLAETSYDYNTYMGMIMDMMF